MEWRIARLGHAHDEVTDLTGKHVALRKRLRALCAPAQRSRTGNMWLQVKNIKSTQL
jgi:hypothetical protein